MNERRYAAIITARAGSKRLPGKNTRPLLGRPLVYYTLDAALECERIASTWVSTDDEEVKRLAHERGAEVIDRPSALASDAALSSDVVAHALDVMAERGDVPSHFVLLQPTSPLRTAEDIFAAIKGYEAGEFLSAVSVAEVDHHPYKQFVLDVEAGLRPLFGTEYLQMPEQSLPKVLRQNGAIYIMPVEVFRRIGSFYAPPVYPHVMDTERSIDIDTALDFTMAEIFLKQYGSGPC